MNEREGLLGASLPSLEPEIAPHYAMETEPLADDPSRTAWEPVVILVPLAQVETHPAYFPGRWLDRESARQRGVYPTLESALDTEQDRRDAVRETLVDVLATPIELALAPIAMISGSWPSAVERDAGEYERITSVRDASDAAPAIDNWRPGVLTNEEPTSTTFDEQIGP